MGFFDAISEGGAIDKDIWNAISEPSDFETILQNSENQPQLIYKHSNRCSICFVAKGNLEKASKDLLKHADMHYLDVVNKREVSTHIAEELDVRHESPQVILLYEGEVVWDASHGQIVAKDILDVLG